MERQGDLPSWEDLLLDIAKRMSTLSCKGNAVNTQHSMATRVLINPSSGSLDLHVQEGFDTIWTTSGMTDDKRKVVIEALGAMCDLVEAQSALNMPSDGLIYNIYDVAALFGVPLNSPKEIDEFSKDLEVGKYALWSKLTKETRSGIIDIIYNRWDTLLNLQKSAPIVDDSLSGKASPSDPIVQSVDINTKSTFYAGAAGASAKDQPTANSNFHPLVADPVFDGVNISNPRKVVEKAQHGLKRIMMNNKGFFFFKFDSHAGLEAVLEGGPWLIRNSPIILKKWSMNTRFLKKELTRISIWVKLHDVPIQVFEEDGISLIAAFIGKPVMLDSYTSAMCNYSWGRSSFAWCLIKVNSKADLTGDGFTKENIRVEYEWRLPSNINTPNSYSDLVNEEEEDKEHMENVNDELTNLFPNSK
ncbi:zinc knuckle CX2CX4HX4C containing protein [Tanacetum coccineum]